MGPGLKAKIISMQKNFTTIEVEIAKYLLENLESVASDGISALADKTGTSEASINRFCKKLGYKGFNAFKVALVQESFYVGLNKNETSDEAPSLAKSLIMDYNDILVNTGLMIDEAQVDLLASQITRARTVYILGTYKTKVVGMELERRLATLGIISKFVSDQSSSRILAQYARDRDVAIFISDSIFSKRVYSLSETLKRRGCFTAGITNNDSTKVTTLLGARIVVADKIMSKYNLSIANNIAYFFAIDLIITKILQGDKDYKFRQIESENILSSLEAIDGNMIDNY